MWITFDVRRSRQMLMMRRHGDPKPLKYVWSPLFASVAGLIAVAPPCNQIVSAPMSTRLMLPISPRPRLWKHSIASAWIGFILPFYQIKPSINQKVKGNFGQCPNLSSLGIAEGSALAKSTQKTKKTCWQSHRGPDFEIILEFYSSDNRGGTTGFFMPCAPLKTKLGNVYLQRTWHMLAKVSSFC